jgi:F-type H+-transporting ATPase subunit b
MSTFFTSFGVNLVSLIFYLLLFGAVFYLLRRFAFGPVLKTIDDRQTRIGQSLDAAAEAVKSVEENRKKAEETLREASSHAQEIIRRAEKAATELHEQARSDAKQQADAIIVKARSEIDLERQAAIAEIRSQVVDLALLAASRVIEANLDDDRNRRLVQETVAQADLRG